MKLLSNLFVKKVSYLLVKAIHIPHTSVTVINVYGFVQTIYNRYFVFFSANV